MKFCPHCGTTFEANARFCLECGFDRSSVETFDPEPNNEPETAKESIPSAQRTCPQCSAKLDPESRFCEECGFDSAIISVENTELAEPLQTPLVEQVVTPLTKTEESPVSDTVKRFCPQCGSSVVSEDRFCPQCGFDTSTETTSIPIPPIAEPAPIRQSQSENIPPVIEAATLSAPVIKPEANVPPINPVQVRLRDYTIPPETNKPAAKQKSKKRGLLLLVIIVALAAIATAGWFAYDAFLNNKPEVPAATAQDMSLPPVTGADATNADNQVMEEPAANSPEPAVSNSKPMSKIDQELAKQKAKQQTKPSQPPVQIQPSKPEQGTKSTQTTNENDQKVTVILEVGRKEEPKNKNPKNPTRLVIQQPTMIVRITTDHYNKGMGTANGGSVTLKDASGNAIATFRAYGRTGTNGTPNAKWVAEPHKVLVAGTYYIWDSDFSTWSKNFLGTGFVVVEGYEVE